MANEWTSSQIEISYPLFSQRCASTLLYRERQASNLINTKVKELYGNANQQAPIAFRIGNGGAGYTGLLKTLADSFVKAHDGSLRIGWVTNPSRFTLVALLPRIVDVALTYGRRDEQVAFEEGWAERVCRVFNDHFVLVGPKGNPAGLQPGVGIVEAMREIAGLGDACFRLGDEGRFVFHSRGNASATYAKEKHLFRLAGVQTAAAAWIATKDAPPYDALKTAAKIGAYHLTDRATFLTGIRDGAIKDMRVYVEGGPELLNPCSAMVSKHSTPSALTQGSNLPWASVFANWLSSDAAQAIVRDYGKDWSHGMPLFTVACEEDFEESYGLVGKDLAGPALHTFVWRPARGLKPPRETA